MTTALHIFCLCLLTACTRPPRVAPSHSGSSATTTSHGTLDAGVDLGERVVVGAVAPGRYAVAIGYHQFSSCSQSFSDYSARASLVMELAPDGAATACRGRETSDVFPNGATPMLEQQGFRGTWRRDGAWVELHLALDATACPQRRGYISREPEPWHLRGLAITPVEGNAVLPFPLLACRFATRVYTEELGYALPQILPGEWAVLGSGDGVRVTLDQGELAPPDVRPSIIRAPARIEFDAWTRR